jgi:uncharacterized protein (DUF427 family)
MAITIETAGGVVVVRAGGAVLGESRKALILREDGYAPVYYLPREDFLVAFLEPSQKRTRCPHKGEARYFHIIVKSGPIRDAVWSYETPLPGVAAIAGHLAFGDERVAVERL